LQHLGETIPETTFEAWWQRYLTLYAEHIADRSRPFDGLVPLLDRLAVQGATLAICTNKSEVLARKLLDALQLSARFAALTGRDTFPDCYKPNPEHLLGTLRLAGGNAGQAVMVGDSEIDVAAARNAGVPVIAVSFGYTANPVANYGPDAVIDHYDDFDAALATIRQKGH
jgi:phosphoglycolate phosphatase